MQCVQESYAILSAICDKSPALGMVSQFGVSPASNLLHFNLNPSVIVVSKFLTTHRGENVQIAAVSAHMFHLLAYIYGRCR